VISDLSTYKINFFDVWLHWDTVNDESYVQEKSFMVFADFQQTVKVFPTNFINLSKAKPQKFFLHYDKIQ